MMLMTTMRSLPILLLVSSLCVTEVAGRSWDLPLIAGRIPSTQLRDFRHGSHAYSHLPLVSSLKGGNQAPTGGRGGNSASSSSNSVSDDIGRGGGGAAAVKTKKLAEEMQAATSTSTPARTPPPKKVPKKMAAAAAAATSTPVKPFTENDDVLPKERTGLSRFLPHRKSFNHKALAKKLKNRNNMNLKRKVMHASFGLFFASLNHLIPKEKFVPGMAILSSATLLMELLRYRKGFGWMNKALHVVLGSSLRKHEMDGKFTGSFYFFTGVTFTAALFPKTCATLGICQLALADPSASYFGRATRHVYWSRIENGFLGLGRNKGILGFLGGAAFCFPFNYRVLSIAKFGAQGIPGGQTSLIVASAALGLAGAFADLAVPTPAWTLPKKICGVRVPPLHLDDNFVVPIFSGFACSKIFQAVGWSQNLALSTFVLI